MSQYLTIVFAAVLGACLGSFANVAAIRLHAMTSLNGRSRCPECDALIRPRHLVPIFFMVGAPRSLRRLRSKNSHSISACRIAVRRARCDCGDKA